MDLARLLWTGPALRLADRDTYRRPCPRCAARPGQPCTYTRRGQIHYAPGTRTTVWNEPGQPTLIPHRERRRPGTLDTDDRSPR
jgi:hypothetical protein